MIFLKRRAMMSRFHFNYKTVAGTGSLILDDCAETNFAQFRLLGNSAQGENPTPENPQEIKSCGKVGKNLFDISQYDKYDDTWTNTTYTTKKLKLKPNTTYTMSCKRLVDKPKQYVIFNILSGIKTGKAISVQINPSLQLNHFTGKGTFTTGETGEIVLNYYVDCPKDQYWFTEVIGDIQIELGSAQTDYEPYTDKKLFDVKLTGRNLINVDEMRNENGYLKSSFVSSTKIKPFKVESGKKYLLVAKGKPLKTGIYSSMYLGEDDLKYMDLNTYVLTTGTGFIIFSENKELKKILIARKTVTVTRVIIHGQNEIKDAYDVEELGLFEMLDDDFQSVIYEPYKEPQTVQLQLDEPLRGIGEYKDDITKDGIVRKIGHLEIKGGLIWNDWGNQFRIIVSVEKAAILYSKYLCNYTNDVKNFGNQHFIYLYFTKEQIEAIGINANDTLEVANKRLNEIVANKPIVIEYPLKTQIFEPFPQETQLALENLHANDGTTVISVDSGEVETGIEVEYAVKE